MSLNFSTKGAYEPRDWAVAELRDEQVPTSTQIERAHFNKIMGVDSELAERTPDTSAVFFYDIEQVYAGLDKVYGVHAVRTVDQDTVLPDGTAVPAGNLMVELTRFDLDTQTMSYMFEV